ncbi:hypothetical protein AMTRI_Chr13g88670 [Amborella trichopoda]
MSGACGITFRAPHHHCPTSQNPNSTTPKIPVFPLPINTNKRFHPLCSSASSQTQKTENKNPLVVVGSANADIYVEIERLPKEGETVAAKRGQTLAGGKGANQAACAGMLDYHPTYFIGQVGEDAHGRLVTDALAQGGICLEHVKRVEGEPTGHAVVMLLGSDGQNSIIMVGGANTSGWPDSLPEEDLWVVRNAGVLLLQREIPDAVNIQVAKVHGVYSLNLPWSEASFVKTWSKGISTFTEGEERPIMQPIIATSKVVDTTGAGDTFTAAFAVALVEGKSNKECLKFAAAAASLCVQVKGAIPSMPNRKAVLELLQSL